MPGRRPDGGDAAVERRPDGPSRARNRFMAVSPRTGTLLYMLARTRQAHGRRVRHLVRRLHPAPRRRRQGQRWRHRDRHRVRTQQGRSTRRSVEAAGLSQIVDIREGDARETLGRDLPDPVDMVLLDGAKEMYRGVLAMLEPHLAPGAIIAADNASRAAAYLDHVRSSGRYLSPDVGGDVEVSLLV